jgi:hypothetical protein
MLPILANSFTSVTGSERNIVFVGSAAVGARLSGPRVWRPCRRCYGCDRRQILKDTISSKPSEEAIFDTRKSIHLSEYV